MMEFCLARNGVLWDVSNSTREVSSTPTSQWVVIWELNRRAEPCPLAEPVPNPAMTQSNRASWIHQPHQAWLKPRAAQGFQQSECTLIAPTKTKLTLVSSDEESDKGPSPLHFHHHCLEDSSDHFSMELNHTSPTHLLLPPTDWLMMNISLLTLKSWIKEKDRTPKEVFVCWTLHCTPLNLLSIW